jgi:hypothetical protein
MPSAVHRLLQVALSDRGYAKATAIVRLYDLLRELSLESIQRDGPQPGFGSLESGKSFYYRVHGPTLVIEFDNPDNNSNHIHSVWHGRDDFAVDLLAKHYRENPHHRVSK